MKFRERIDQIFKYCEDVIYVTIGVVLLVTSAVLLIFTFPVIVSHIGDSDYVAATLHVLDRILLVIMFIEILYTVRVSLISHSLCAEPFLIVGLIAAIRRILVITVEGAHVLEKFTYHMIESGVLGGLCITFVVSIVLLRKYRLEKEE
ncbi:MAG: hypothetical protein JXR45_06480 [Deltaproteobacteria bacterium]|nr:hypothetical protein [Deltaproteobacteria bacterium]